MANKKHLIDELERNGVDRKTADRMITAVCAAIINVAIEQGHVSITGVGTFDTPEREPRSGRNPKTGETVVIPSKRALRFRPATSVRQAVERGERVTGRRAKPARAVESGEASA